MPTSCTGVFIIHITPVCPAVVLIGPAALCPWWWRRAALASFVVIVVAAIFLVGTCVVAVAAAIAV